jgi:hypothetical protein
LPRNLVRARKSLSRLGVLAVDRYTTNLHTTALIDLRDTGTVRKSHINTRRDAYNHGRRGTRNDPANYHDGDEYTDIHTSYLTNVTCNSLIWPFSRSFLTWMGAIRQFLGSLHRNPDIFGIPQHAHRFYTGCFSRVGAVRTRIRIRSRRRRARGTRPTADGLARRAVQLGESRGTHCTSVSFRNPPLHRKTHNIFIIRTHQKSLCFSYL